MATSTEIRDQYEAWPYPRMPLWASVDRAQLWQLNAAWIADRCGLRAPPQRARIWITGCGTFQPYVFARANPGAEIIATDLSATSLAIARRRCRVHGIKNVEFRQVDLEDPSQWPTGTFDLIESYGVLMNLEQPEIALAGLRQRLEPQGVLRAMVYPHYSRQRVFQLQRVAKRLGLTARDPSHPTLLKKAVRTLHHRHPLRYAWDSYSDTRSKAGIVDAFLHAGDRGFSAYEFLDLVDGAGLRPAFWFQREWGQPALAADNLGLQGKSQAAVLNYLDLWQELRSNFVACLTRKGPPPENGDIPRPTADNLAAHPLFDPSHPELGPRHRLHLLRAKWLGTKLPSKVSDPVRLSRTDARLLQGGPDAWAQADPRRIARLTADGLLLGTEPWCNPQPVVEPLAGEAQFRTLRLELHPRAANPLFQHLFQAWTADLRLPALGLPDLEGQMGRWIPHADPLEAQHAAFGLTPYRTMQLLRRNVEEYRNEWGEREAASSWDQVRLRSEPKCFAELYAWAARAGLPPITCTDAEKRELWCLLFPYDSLWVPLLPA